MNLREKILKINDRLKEIELRLKDSGVELEELTQLDLETRELVEKRTGYTIELKGNIEKSFKESEVVDPAPTPVDKEEEERAKSIKEMSKRDKIAYVIGKGARNKALTPVEKRALGVALTTTSAVYSAATEQADGVNNAGIFIPTHLVLDLLREEELLSPILSDIVFTRVPGLTEFPYRESRDKARVKVEGIAGKDNQMKWATLRLEKGVLQTIIAVTDEILALTDFNLGEYIVNQILQDINEDWLEHLIYGTGADNQIKGLTIGATPAVTDGYAANKATEAIIAGIKLLKGQYRRNAKLYVAQDVYDEIFFATDDNGNFKYPVFNNSVGISSIGVIKAEVDENLKEGEFLIGNIGKYFKANTLIPLRLETERISRRLVTEWVASEFCATAPFPGAFVHGTKRA